MDYSKKYFIASWIANVSYHCRRDPNQNEHQQAKKSNAICTYLFFSTILLWTLKESLLPSKLMAYFDRSTAITISIICNHTWPARIVGDRNKQMKRKSVSMPLPMLKTGHLHVRLNTETSYRSLPSPLCHHPAVQMSHLHMQMKHAVSHPVLQL